jgi:hypothetical protein
MSIGLNVSLPYPVLGLGDDFKDGGFSVKPKIYLRDGDLHIEESDLEITNEYILDLTNEGKVVTAYKIHCPSTLYSKTFTGEKLIKISEENLANDFSLEVFLVAGDDIDEYCHESFNDDYYNADSEEYFSFEVKKGNIIGLFGAKVIPLNYTYTSGISGLFRFQRREDSPIIIDLENNFIEIIYPHEQGSELDILNIMSRNGKMTFLNLFIIPALTDAFDILMKETKDQNIEGFKLEKQWAMILSESYPEFVNDTHPFTSAQKFLQMILEQSMGKSQIPVLEAFNEIQR